MIALMNEKTRWPKNETLKAEIVALVAAIEAADLGHDALLIPQYWELGRKLERFEGDLETKSALAKGQSRYYRARRIHRQFSTMAKARAFRGSLRDLLGVMKKGIKGRYPTPAKIKAARALIKAAGNIRAALLLLIQEGHCNINNALEWLQKAEAQQRTAEVEQQRCNRPHGRLSRTRH